MIKYNKLYKYLLVLICIFFLLTRLYKIGEIPPSVYWDEASIGYNVYSVLKTGKDEWGKFLPVHFRAFGEFKLPVYIYSTVPFVKIFGLNELSVRLPSVLFSLGVVILTYFLSRKLTGYDSIGSWSSFFVSISPWFFIFSRTGYEATAGLMFFTLAIYLFFFYAKNGWFIFFSLLSFILSAYSYNSFRISAPLTIIILLFYERASLKVLTKSAGIVIFSLILLVLSIWPIYRLYVYDAGISRFHAVGGVNIISSVKNYISHFSPNFLLYGDKNLRSQQAGFGQIYPMDLLLMPLGLLYLLTSKSKYRLIPLVLLLFGPIPASLTKESPHALRSIGEVPFISIISSMGVFFMKKYISGKFVLELVLLVISILFFANYFITFLNVYPGESASAWQYEYKKFFIQNMDEFDKYDRVIITDKYAQPYIFALFYLRYDPAKFQKEVVRNSVDQWGFSTVSKFGKFEFGKDNGQFGLRDKTLILR